MRLALLLLVLATASCGTGTADVAIVRTAIGQIWKGEEEDAPKGKRTLTRAQINELGAAMIQVNLAGDPSWPILVAASQNGPYVTYATKAKQSVTLRESQVTGTRGLGTDLISATSSDNDPLKVLTQPDNWPEQVTREFRFAGAAPVGRIERYTCRLVKAGPAKIEIAKTPFDVIGFAEVCQGEDGKFQNLHAADARTGRVWQSQQFIGRGMPPITIEVLEPVTE